MKQVTVARSRTLAANCYDYPQYYDIALQPYTETEANFIEAACRKYCPFVAHRFLEPACGTGRLVTEWAARGYQVTGFDRSQRVLGYLRRLSASSVPLLVENVQSLLKSSHFEQYERLVFLSQRGSMVIRCRRVLDCPFQSSLSFCEDAFCLSALKIFTSVTSNPQPCAAYENRCRRGKNHQP
jgi:SAM-dependent methyltransferase